MHFLDVYCLWIEFAYKQIPLDAEDLYYGDPTSNHLPALGERPKRQTDK